MLLTYPTGNYRSLLKNIREIYTAFFLDLPSIKLKRLYFQQQSIEGIGLEFQKYDKFAQLRPYATYSIDSIEQDRIVNATLQTLRVLYALKSRFGLKNLEYGGFILSRLSNNIPLSSLCHYTRVQSTLQLFTNSWSEAYELSRFVEVILGVEKPFTVRNLELDICFELQDLDTVDQYQKEWLLREASFTLTDEASNRQLLCFKTTRWVQVKLLSAPRIDQVNIPFENGQDVYYTANLQFEFFLPEPVAIFLPDRDMSFTILEGFSAEIDEEITKTEQNLVLEFKGKGVPVTAMVTDNYSEFTSPFIALLPFITTTQFERDYQYPMYVNVIFYENKELKGYIKKLLNISDKESDNQINLLNQYLQNLATGNKQKPSGLKIDLHVLDAETYKPQDIETTDYFRINNVEITSLSDNDRKVKLDIVFNKPTLLYFTPSE